MNITNSIDIRPLTATDYDAFCPLMQQLHSLHVAGRPDLFREAEFITSRERYEQLLAEEDTLLLGAFKDGELIGFAAGEIRRRSMMMNTVSLYVTDLFIDEGARRRGVAACLLRELQARAKRAGAVRCDIMVWQFNEAAIAFYEAQGFSVQRSILEKML
ncbi:MAG: GNAT family N-acetyltransferase [Oscillospiraceae bacterium]|nr:GNAT family N-acetyltransferase [Oscillospiraceae bacterium]